MSLLVENGRTWKMRQVDILCMLADNGSSLKKIVQASNFKGWDIVHVSDQIT